MKAEKCNCGPDCNAWLIGDGRYTREEALRMAASEELFRSLSTALLIINSMADHFDADLERTRIQLPVGVIDVQVALDVAEAALKKAKGEIH